MYSDWDQDEEDEKGPYDLNQQLDLRKEDKKGWRQTLIKQIQEEWLKKHETKYVNHPKTVTSFAVSAYFSVQIRSSLMR